MARLSSTWQVDRPSGITLAHLYMSLGLLDQGSVVKPLTEEAFKVMLERKWREDLENSPHGHHWHTSFHASSFPGDDEYACGRKQIYTLLNAPNEKPVDRRGRFFMEMGKAGELILTDAWAKTGVLISTDQSTDGRATVQTGFVEPEVWLTGNSDALLLPKGWNMPFPVEVKFVRHQTALELQKGLREPTPKHVRQHNTYVAGLHKHLPKVLPWVLRCKESGYVATGVVTGACRYHTAREDCLFKQKLDPIKGGAIIYVSFDDSDTMAEFYLPLDMDFYEAGVEQLRKFKANYLAEQLPMHSDPAERKRHPNGTEWGWSADPCKYCDFKKHVCKPDWKADISDLRESHAIAYAQEVRGHYDYDETRDTVLSRWKETDG